MHWLRRTCTGGGDTSPGAAAVVARSARQLVDDHVVEPESRRPGRPKRLTDAELVCLAVAQVLLGARFEHHWIPLSVLLLSHVRNTGLRRRRWSLCPAKRD
ncbi:hypothetical protein, partial [Mycobacterium canetti]|uniref:hypothetical protein n=1 Tax=Mycobacterium canetti TaxID=78331 RepID=UPI001EE6C8C6